MYDENALQKEEAYVPRRAKGSLFLNCAAGGSAFSDHLISIKRVCVCV